MSSNEMTNDENKLNEYAEKAKALRDKIADVIGMEEAGIMLDALGNCIAFTIVTVEKQSGKDSKQVMLDVLEGIREARDYYRSWDSYKH